MLIQLYRLAKTWLCVNVFYKSRTNPRFKPLESETPYYEPEIVPLKSLDELSDGDLIFDSRVTNVVVGNSYKSPEKLVREGFRKIDAILFYPLFGWPRAAVEALKLVAYEMQFPLQKTFDTYDIFILIPNLRSGCNEASVWVRPKPKPPKDDDDKRKKLGEDIIEMEVVKPKAMAAKAR